MTQQNDTIDAISFCRAMKKKHGSPVWYRRINEIILRPRRFHPGQGGLVPQEMAKDLAECGFTLRGRSHNLTHRLESWVSEDGVTTFDWVRGVWAFESSLEDDSRIVSMSKKPVREKPQTRYFLAFLPLRESWRIHQRCLDDRYETVRGVDVSNAVSHALYTEYWNLYKSSGLVAFVMLYPLIFLFGFLVLSLWI